LDDTEVEIDWRFPLVLAILFAIPNWGVVGVWAFTFANEWFLHTQESVPVYSLTIFGGTLASLIGLAAGALGLSAAREKRARRWWIATLAINAFGLAINCAGFVGYMAPGC
jgi:hypothetical protein